MPRRNRLGGLTVGNQLSGKVDVACEGEVITPGIEFMGLWHSAGDE